VVEFHGTGRELAPAIQARYFAEFVKQSLVVSPVAALPFDVSTFAGPRLSTKAFVKQLLRPDSMAVHANDVAFRDFGQKFRGGHQHRSTRHQIEPLGGRISVIEVHLERFEPLSAIRAGNSAQISEHFDSAGLPYPHSRNFEFAIAPVVGNVRRALARSRRHA
jgi:hypothetical protein